ncbi:terpene synthase family protein [Chitinophaga pinensis]|uniref:Terpene synthase n=1 Tax=Chitinophaga pinensis (strain ATCC 43595 / DSM 2588 / LMG 13176 / NBRC 15968 / NCIMB 11800 / UQM 2034) TaxID=485918 RepID=A0A979G646_CHIPD|nr:terpene synthase metal-binding domain-containing protein [Chitinophaga pinensis]ACU61560.1 Terpene synthase metal-binding domain protein [Chitinophaga pinensis DSM 2588]
MYTQQLPGLYCPFPSLLNQYVEKADKHTTLWVKKYQLVTNEDTWSCYHRQKFTWMVARMFPTADLNALSIAADLNTLLFILDDQFDEHGEGSATIKQQEQFERLVHALIGIMKHNSLVSLEKGGPVLSAVSDFWKRIRKLGNLGWQVRFIESLQQAFAANLWRIEQVSRGQLPTLEEYMKWRPFFSGASFFAHLLEAIEAFYLPDYVFLDTTVKTLIMLCSNTICWANDLFSFNKELEQGDEMNIVMLICNTRGCSLEEAIATAAAIHDDQVRQFELLSAQLPSFGTVTDAQLGRYIAALSVMMKGNIEWSVKDTARYRFTMQTV